MNECPHKDICINVCVCVFSVHVCILPALIVPSLPLLETRNLPTLHHLNEVSVKHHIT